MVISPYSKKPDKKRRLAEYPSARLYPSQEILRPEQTTFLIDNLVQLIEMGLFTPEAVKERLIQEDIDAYAEIPTGNKMLEALEHAGVVDDQYRLKRSSTDTLKGVSPGAVKSTDPNVQSAIVNQAMAATGSGLVSLKLNVDWDGFARDPLEGKKVKFWTQKTSPVGLMRGHLKIEPYDNSYIEYIDSLQETSSYFLFEYGKRMINVNYDGSSVGSLNQVDLLRWRHGLEARQDELHGQHIAPKRLASGLIQGKYPYLVMQVEGVMIGSFGFQDNDPQTPKAQPLKPEQVKSVKNLIGQLIRNKWVLAGPPIMIWDGPKALLVGLDQVKRLNWDNNSIVDSYLQAYRDEKNKWEEIDPGHEIYEFLLSLLRVQRVNALSKEAYHLPVANFGVKGVNLIDVFAHAWQRFSQEHSIPRDAKIVIKPIGSVNYAVDSKGNLNWDDISSFEFISYLPEPLTSLQKTDFGAGFTVRYLGEAMSKLGLKIEIEEGRKLYLVGQRWGKPYRWEFIKFPFNRAPDALVEHEKLLPYYQALRKRMNSGDMYYYQLLGSYFELSADASAREADLSGLLKRASLEHLIENTAQEYRNVCKEALEMFQENDPKAFKRLAVAARLVGNQGRFRTLMREFVKYFHQGRIYQGVARDHQNHEFYQYTQALNIDDDQLRFEIASAIIGEFSLKTTPDHLLRLMNENGGDIELGELVRKIKLEAGNQAMLAIHYAHIRAYDTGEFDEAPLGRFSRNNAFSVQPDEIGFDYYTRLLNEYLFVDKYSNGEYLENLSGIYKGNSNEARKFISPFVKALYERDREALIGFLTIDREVNGLKVRVLNEARESTLKKYLLGNYVDYYVDKWVRPEISENSSTGGIDLTPVNMNLQTKMDSSSIKFHLDAAMLHQFQKALGFVPVIINIQPMTNLRQFLGLDAKVSVPANI